MEKNEISEKNERRKGLVRTIGCLRYMLDDQLSPWEAVATRNYLIHRKKIKGGSKK